MKIKRPPLTLLERLAKLGAGLATVDRDGQHRTGKHAARAAICREQGRPNTGRQWRKARKALRAKQRARAGA